MRIIYHHRTRSTDAQRIHIREIVKAFESFGHEVEIVSLIPIDAQEGNAERDASEALWKRCARRVPFGYEIVQLAYNLVGIPMLLAALWRRNVHFIYERYSLFNFTGVIAARLFGIPLILEVNSPFALEQSRDKEIRSFRLAQWSERFICNHATQIITVSTPLARILQSSGISRRLITVMANGVSIEDFRPGVAEPELLAKLGLVGQVVIGFVGWFRNWHGLDLLLRAFHQGNPAALGAKLLLIGDGPAMSGLRATVRELSLEQNVIFAGPVPHVEVPRYLDLIDITVQPSANEYCCPMKILEYMALGKAIVAPRQENIQELLHEPEEAQFFTQGDVTSLMDALVTLVRDRQRRIDTGLRAKAAITGRGYLWTTNAQRVIEISESALRLSSVSVEPESASRF